MASFSPRAAPDRGSRRRPSHARRARTPAALALADLPRRGRAADGALRVGAALRGQRTGLQPARPLARRGDRRRRAPLQARLARAVALVRRRDAAVLARRPLHLQLPAALRRRRPVPVAGRRRLRRRLPGPHGGPAHAHPPAQPGERPRGRHRLADHDAGPGPALVGRPHRAVPARRDDDADGQAGLGRLSAGRHPPAGRRHPPRGRHRQAPAGLLPAGLRDRGAARHRLRLRRGDAARRLSRPGHPRHRLDQLLPALGRGGPAPVDASARAAGARPRPAPDVAAPDPADRGVAHRAGRRGDAGAAPGQPRSARHHRRLGGALRPRRAAHGRARAPAGALRRPRAHAERSGRLAGGRHRPRRRSTAPP